MSYITLLVRTGIFALSTILITLGTAPIYAQDGEQDGEQECVELEGTPPGLYATTDEGLTYLTKDGKMVQLGPGEAAFASEDKLACIKTVPKFLDWPCSTEAANSRKFNTYAFGDLPDGNKPKEIVRRYFEIPEVIEPIPRWIDGEFHATFTVNEIIQFASPEYWYLADQSKPILSAKRPKIQLISLYVGINKVVLDNYTLDPLQAELGADSIPVVFVFNDTNVVPISYFGDNVSLEEISKAFMERQIKVADVPMWEDGDHHLLVTIEEFEKYFDIPPLEEIDEVQRKAIALNFETNGWAKKPIFVTLLADSSAMSIDLPERVRVAQSLGFDRLPTVIFFIEADSHLQRCGPGDAQGASVSGSTTPISGPLVPAGSVPPPPPEPEASDS